MSARLLVLVVLGFALSGCGLLIDGAYLLAGPRYTTEEEQRRPTGEVQRGLEHEVRVEGAVLSLACEDVERNVDRAWQVRKQWEYQGGIYQAHWLPIILEGAVAAGIGIGVGIKCNEPGTELSCTPLWATVPLGADVLYSVVRLLTIDPPKLVNKERLAPHAAVGDATARSAVACEPDARIQVGRGPDDPLAVQVRVDERGTLQPGGQEQLVKALYTQDVSLWWKAGGAAPVAASLSRCAALEALHLSLPGNCPTRAP